MTSNKAVRVLLVCVCLLCVFALSACKEKMPPYDNIVQAVESYHDQYSDYLNAGDGNAVTVNNDNAVMKDGTACRSYYFKSSDGKYESVSLEFDRGDVMYADEYFYLSEKAIYIVRSYLDPDSMIPSITKYYVWYGDMYLINEEAKELSKADDEATAQFYSSFDELISHYGPQSR